MNYKRHFTKFHSEKPCQRSGKPAARYCTITANFRMPPAHGTAARRVVLSFVPPGLIPVARPLTSQRRRSEELPAVALQHLGELSLGHRREFAAGPLLLLYQPACRGRS